VSCVLELAREIKKGYRTGVRTFLIDEQSTLRMRTKPSVPRVRFSSGVGSAVRTGDCMASVLMVGRTKSLGSCNHSPHRESMRVKLEKSDMRVGVPCHAGKCCLCLRHLMVEACWHPRSCSHLGRVRPGQMSDLTAASTLRATRALRLRDDG
jgi:hypothetical protein